jgi:iron complex outermembrane recepter protein
MHLRKIFSFLIPVVFVLSPQLSYGQTLSVTVSDNERMPLPGAGVQLTELSSSIKLVRVTDLKGKALFAKVPESRYKISISFIGFQTIDEEISIKPGNNELSYRMKEDAIMLNEAVVEVRRPVLRQEDDKMIIDIESMAAISTNALEILESTPGLLVDPDGGIFLSSATPSVIYINGREQKMSTQDILSILRSLPPGNVQRIEVMRTPSAKYSASTSGGIINVVLKKGVRIGRFGSVRAGMNQGRYGNRFAGLNFNNSNDKSTIYINLEYSRNDMLEELSSIRTLTSESTLFQEAETRRQANQGYIGYGYSTDAGKKLNFSYDGRLNASSPESTSLNSNIIRGSDGLVLSEADNTTKNNSAFFSIRQELGAIYRIDTSGSELDTRFSYSFNQNKGTQDYMSLFRLPVSRETKGDSRNNNNGHFIQLQSDLSYRLPADIRFESGFNSSLQLFSSSSEYFNFTGGVRTPDILRSKSYSYRENTNAFYVQASRDLMWRFMLKTGLRMEHTYMKGTPADAPDKSFVISRADFFPYLYLSRPLMDIAGYDLRAYAIYRRTIARPGYEILNPAVRYTDQFFYETGNPALKPQFTSNGEINISIDDMPLFAFGQNYVNDIFSSVVYTDKTSENVAYRTYDNLGKNRETYFRITGGIPPMKKYFFYVGAQFNLNEYDGMYENQSLRYERESWRFFTYHALRITPRTRITLNGMLVTKGQMNLYELDTFGQVNLGLNQTFFDRKLSVSLSARDILRTMANNFRLDQGSITTYGSRYSDNRRVGVNINWNFGINSKPVKEKKLDFGFIE